MKTQAQIEALKRIAKALEINKKIEAKLKKLNKEVNNNTAANWAVAGSVGHVLEELEEINRFLA